MTRTRMMKGDHPGDDGQETAEAPSPRTTIVGGRPPEDNKDLPPVPTGIQSLLRLASVDAAFRDELVQRRAGIAGAANVPLTGTEQAILGAISDEQLEEMAAKMPPPPPARRDFLRQTAATAVVLLGGAAMAETLQGCCVTEALEERVDRPEHNDMLEDGGADPHYDEDPVEPADDDSAEAATPTPTEQLQETTPIEIEATPPPPPKTRGHSHDTPPPRKSRGKPGVHDDEPTRTETREMQTEGGAAPDEP